MHSQLTLSGMVTTSLIVAIAAGAGALVAAWYARVAAVSSGQSADAAQATVALDQARRR
jgi:hypothetical protein